MNYKNNKLVVENLSCVRDDRILFQSLNFSLQNGQALVVEGQNGCGKTSLLRILCGFHLAEHGTIFWSGDQVSRLSDEYFHNLTYVSHKNGLKDELTVEENLYLSAGVLGVTLLDSNTLLHKIGLIEQADLFVRQLSAGQKRRLALSRLLLTQSPLWLLDEPFTSLDKDSIVMFEELLQNHLQNGGMLIVTAHHDINLLDSHVQRINLSDN